MKKLLLTALIVISMSLASYAGIVNAATLNTNGNNTESIEKAKPHTQQYKDMKKILDEFEQDVKKAQSCEDLENAELTLFLKLMTLIEKDYDEDLTAEEDEELTDQMNRIDQKVTKLQQQWGCETEDDDNETTEQSVKPTTTEEWEEIINDFDALVKKLDKMKDLDLEDEDNLDELLEFIMEAQPLQERMDSADPETLTDRQAKRLEDLNDRFTAIAKQMGLIDED